MGSGEGEKVRRKAGGFLPPRVCARDGKAQTMTSPRHALGLALTHCIVSSHFVHMES